MLVDAQIKLKTPLLGDKVCRDRVKRFSRENSVATGILPLDTPLWIWALSEAAKSLNIVYTPEAFRMASEVTSPTICLYNRKWVDKKGRKHTDQFEAVRAGTILTVPFILFDNPSPGKEGPVLSLKEFGDMLSLTGSMIGVSPWGSKFGYGRFKLVKLKQK